MTQTKYSDVDVQKSQQILPSPLPLDARPPDPPGQLHVLGHHRHPPGVQGAQHRVLAGHVVELEPWSHLEQLDHEGLRGLLQRLDGGSLEAELVAEPRLPGDTGGHLTDQPGTTTMS